MKKEYQITIGSPIDYEQLVAFISINEKRVGLINQDGGEDNLEIELFDCDGMKIDYDTFIEALDAAKKALLR